MTALVQATGPEIEVAAGGAFPNSVTLTSGNYVVTWLDMAGPTNETLVAVFNSEGTQVGTIYTMTAATGYHATAPLASGGFVVVYTTTGQAIAQIFDSTGVPSGVAVPLGTIDYYSNSTFDVEGLAGGGFAASWRNGTTISVKTFDATGSPVATITPDVGPGGSAPQISELSNGTLILTWHEYDLVSPFSGGYPDGYEVSAQLFSSGGTALSPRLTVNQTQTGSHAEPQIVALADGGFVVAWVAQGDALAGGAGIWCQIYDAAGTAVGSNIRVSDLMPGYQAQPDIAALSWGGFLVTWMDSSPNNPENFSSGIRAQLFDGTGTPLGDTIQVNAQLYADEVNPSVVIVSDTEARIFFRSDGNADPSGLLERVITLPVTGTEGDDTLSGTGANARIIGLDGADTITGTGGDDNLVGGDGNDTLSGLGGDDEMHGGGGADLMDGGDGNDLLIGDVGDDIIKGGGGNDLLYGAEGNDTLDGEDGDDTLIGGAGNDLLDGAAGNDVLYGEDGDDVLVGGPGNDQLEGGAGTDTADYSSSATWVTASLLINQARHGTSSNSNDYYTDQLIGIENLTGGSFGDQLVGDGGNNRLDGGAGNDDLVGWFGNDILIGGSGNDYLSGREDADILTGGAGNDTFTDTASGLSGDTITDFGVGDRIIISDANIGGFSFSLNGNTLTYTGGSLTLGASSSGTIIARAAVGGGVELVIQDVRNDFNGDGRSDVLWRADSGQMTDWLGQANGGFVDNSGNATTFVPVSWQVAGTGDLNGDGRDDILWRNSDGSLTNWLGTASGGFTDNGANGYTVVATSWHVAGIADFNGDGRDDILWRNDSGAMTNWLGTASGGYADNSANASVAIGTAWQIAGTGDFNGDGRDDILWRNSDGSLTDWLGQANGSLANNASASTSVATSWHIAATGDFNGDGRDDILWRNDDGSLTDWLGQANGSFANNPNASVWVPTSWHIAATGDFNGDGRDDILWRNDSGDLTNWLGQADGGFANNANASTWVPTNWLVQVDSLL